MEIWGRQMVYMLHFEKVRNWQKLPQNFSMDLELLCLDLVKSRTGSDFSTTRTNA